MKLTGSVTRPGDTTQYTAGDVVAGGTPATIKFDVVARPGGGGIHCIEQGLLIDSANQATKGDFDLFLFDADVTVDADNAAFTPSDAEMETLVGVISFVGSTAKAGDITAGAGGNLVTAVDCSVCFESSVTKLYGVLVARSAYTPVASEKFTLNLSVKPAR